MQHSGVKKMGNSYELHWTTAVVAPKSGDNWTEWFVARFKREIRNLKARSYMNQLVDLLFESTFHSSQLAAEQAVAHLLMKAKLG